MSKEEIFKQFIYTLEDDIKNKTFLTYEEENEWKDYLERIINSQTKKQKEVLDKIKEYINHAQNYGTIAQVMPHLKPYVNGDEILELLEEIE